MQLIGEFQTVINVLRFAAHMLLGTVVLDAASDTGLQVLLEQGQQLGLGRLDLVMVRHKPSPAFEGLGFAVR